MDTHNIVAVIGIATDSVRTALGTTQREIVVIGLPDVQAETRELINALCEIECVPLDAIAPMPKPKEPWRKKYNDPRLRNKSRFG
jgi:hypothetical protein